MERNQKVLLLVEGSVKNRVCFFVVISIMLAMPLGATTVQRLNLDDLVSKAQTIVVGRVVDSHASWTKNGRLILTQTTVAVQEQLKGNPEKTITVTTVGGQVGKTILHVSGMPVFQRDETAVIFLEKSGAYSTVLGLSQGKFSVRNGEVANTLDGLSFSNAAGSFQPVRMPVEEFKRQIQQRLHR